MALKIGDIIDGKYKIVRLLGEGGMGSVFEGENTRIHRKVAIKVLHGEVAANAEVMTRFEREAQAAGRIGSEHIVEVLDLGDLPGGERYMVMEYLEGEALSDRLARGRLTPRAIASLIIDTLEGVKAAHRAQIVHRDLKPDNVFLVSNGSGKSDFVKIVDFGISKFNSLGGEFSMTRTGAVMGTPYYMAPEQAKGGKAVDHRVDVYALGIILYQAVVGQVPFQAETFNELLFKIVLDTPAPLSEQVPGIDTNFVNLVSKAMHRDPDLRYQSAEEFQTALKSWLGGGRILEEKTVHRGTPAMMEQTQPFESASPESTLTSENHSLLIAEAKGLQATGEATAGSWESEATAIPIRGASHWKILIGVGLTVALLGGLTLAFSGDGNDSQASEESSKKIEDEKLIEEHSAAVAQEESEPPSIKEVNNGDLRVEAEQKASQQKASEVAPPVKVVEEPKKVPSSTTPRVRTPATIPNSHPAATPAPAPVPAQAPASTIGRSGGRIINTDL